MDIILQQAYVMISEPHKHSAHAIAQAYKIIEAHVKSQKGEEHV